MKAEPVSQITESNLREFSKISSDYMVQKNIRAYASLLHEDFELIDNVSPYSPQILDKFTYIKRSANLSKVASEIKNDYKITSINISSDGQSAYLTVEVVNQFLIRGNWKKSYALSKYHVVISNGSLKLLTVETIENRDISDNS